MRRLPVLPTVFALVVVAPPALAVDGVLEINQACAVTTGCFAGDAVGFTVMITQPGSYRLTGDLTLSVANEAIEINAPDVTLDLNGFTITGAGAGTGSNDGIQIKNVAEMENVEVRNGTVREFGRHGVFTGLSPRGMRAVGIRALGNGSGGIQLEAHGTLVRDCTVAGNGGIGIRGIEATLIVNTVFENTSWGLLINNAGYGSNVVFDNNGGNQNVQVQGTGVQLTGNVCGTAACP